MTDFATNYAHGDIVFRAGYDQYKFIVRNEYSEIILLMEHDEVAQLAYHLLDAIGELEEDEHPLNGDDGDHRIDSDRCYD